MTNGTNGEEGQPEVTIPVEDWATAEWPAPDPVETTEDETRPALRWRRSLVVLTRADADTGLAGK